jgi:rod shape-determining protein MreC
VDERRIGWLLIAILAAQLVVLAAQAPGGDGSGSALEAVGLRLVGPLARFVLSASDSFAGTRENLKLRRTLLDENRDLRREVADLRLQLLRLRDVGAEMSRLARAIEYAAPPVGEIRAADVVYVDHASWLRTLVLYAGNRPARVNQPVLTPDGLVGRVVVVSGPWSKVQLITDRAAAVGGMIVRTRRQAVVRGGGAGGGLELAFMPLQADVRLGDRVVTAGIDGVFPRGIPIGTVATVEPGGQLFHSIRLIPAVDFGTLDQVYLLESTPVPADLKEALPGVRP